MKHLSKSDSVLLLFFALSVISLLLCTHMFASTQRQNNYSIGINIAPSILCSIEIAKAPIEFDDIDLQEETPNIVENTDINTPYPKWVKIFDNRNSVFTNLVNIIDGKIVFENTRGDSTINTILGGPLTSEDVVFFRISNLSDAVELRCSLEDTGANGYSFVTSPTTTINSTEYVLTEIKETPKVFYVYPNAWYQNQKLDFNINIEATPLIVFGVTTSLSNCEFAGDNTATNGTLYEATVSPGSGFTLPSTIIVTIGQTNYTVESGIETNGITYDQTLLIENITIAGASIVGNINITVVAGYSVTTQLTNCTFDGKNTKTPNMNYEGNLLPVHSSLPLTITISIDGQPYTAKSNGTETSNGMIYFATLSSGTITIPSSITGNIVITVVATLKNYTVDFNTNSTFCEFSGELTANYGIDYSGIITVNAGYKLPNTISIAINLIIYTIESEIENDYGITYNSSTGVITIPGAMIVGNIIITTLATEEELPILNVWEGGTTSFLSSGDGSEGTPYLISSAEELADLAQQVNNGNSYEGKYFQLTNDIYLNDETFEFDTSSGLVKVLDNNVVQYCIGTGIAGTVYHSTTPLNRGDFYTTAALDSNSDDLYSGTRLLNSWTPIGNETHFFQGTFVGGIFVSGATDDDDDILSGSYKFIYGIYINDPDANNLGLFGNVDGAYLGLCYTNGLIIGNSNVGGLVGNGTNGNYELCSNQAIVIGNDNVGGIAGNESAIIFERCENEGYIIGNENIGGIFGNNSTGEIYFCKNVGNVIGVNYVGGIAGSSETRFVNCTNSGDIVGIETNVGQICGNPKLDVSEEEIIEEEEE